MRSPLLAVMLALATHPAAGAPGKVVRIDHREPRTAPSREIGRAHV